MSTRLSKRVSTGTVRRHDRQAALAFLSDDNGDACAVRRYRRQAQTTPRRRLSRPPTPVRVRRFQSPSPLPRAGQIEQRRPGEARRQRATGRQPAVDTRCASRSSATTIRQQRHAPQGCAGVGDGGDDRAGRRGSRRRTCIGRGPTGSRCDTLRSTSSAQSHGPDQSSARAV